uniref:RAB24, member RAS onco family n=1 Tax=Anas platyrhynchos platyrhynchos TaxID=8840 RepID=A0A493U1J6_ANAPP
MSRIYYRGARAAIVCYGTGTGGRGSRYRGGRGGGRRGPGAGPDPSPPDLTNSSSFQRAKFWVNELQNCEEGCRIYLCGTKSDLLEDDPRTRAVDFHDAQDYADEVKAELFETSSKTGQSVGEQRPCRGGTPRVGLGGGRAGSGGAAGTHAAPVSPPQMSCSRRWLRTTSTSPPSR